MTDHKPTHLVSDWRASRMGGESATAGAVRFTAAARRARNWTGRPQPNARHAAITKSLFNFPSYKSWTEKVENHWQDPEKKDKP